MSIVLLINCTNQLIYRLATKGTRRCCMAIATTCLFIEVKETDLQNVHRVLDVIYHYLCNLIVTNIFISLAVHFCCSE